MGKVTQIKRTTKRVKKVPNGYHRCKTCGGDGVYKNKKGNT